MKYHTILDEDLKRRTSMRWHYIEKDEWPEETDTMVLCECHFDKFPEYHVAMYSDFEGVKDFIVEDVKDHHAYYSIRNYVYAWIPLGDIIEDIHFSEMYEGSRHTAIGARIREG